MPKGYSLRSYLTAATAARAGDEMSGPAMLLAGLAITGSTTDASTLLAGITVSAAVGGPVLGALLDRAGRPGRLLAGALALYATGLMVILAGLGRLPMVCTLPLAVLTGLLGPALSGGWTAQLPRVAADARLSRANALDAMTFGVASLAGPALAGGVAELLGASTALALAAALITAAVPAAWRLPAGPVRDRGTRSAPVAGALAAGFRVAAPCPHSAACPIEAGTDWCHFAARVSRSSLHRQVKSGSLAYEDEKFSYVAATRLPVEPAASRVVRRPQIRKGQVLLDLCASDERLRRSTVTKRHGDLYKAARDAAWGDPWPPGED
ncbi:MFS transporter [Streptomyces violaceoruber]